VSDPLGPRPIPLLTAGLPGAGGAARVSEEDFRVEELPLYPAAGEGDHLFITVEKTGRNTQDVAQELGRILQVAGRDVGSAGLKDKRAVTVQRLSVPLPRGTAGPQAVAKAEEFRARALAATGQGWRVLAAERHGNKLRTGHLAGNRFTVVLRGCVPEGLARAQAVLEVLARRGVPNLFGPQRFGRRGDNASLGAAILRKDPGVARSGRDRFLRKLALSALQSEVFNRCLADRIASDLFSVAIAGDVLKKRDSGGLFTCEYLAADQPRVERGEVDPAGPLPGRQPSMAREEARRREDAVLAGMGLTPEMMAEGGGEMEGTRRPYRVPLGEAQVVEREPGVLALTFALPPGSFAAAVLREVMKPGAQGSGAAPGADQSDPAAEADSEG
jgi:tRNA pseudouridine13 synthase